MQSVDYYNDTLAAQVLQDASKSRRSPLYIAQSPECERIIEITDIAVEGLLKPHFGFLSHKCYAELNVGDQKRTTSKVERSSDSVQWQERYSFSIAASSTLEIRVYDSRQSPPKYHFVGGIHEGIKTLCSQQDEQATIRSLGSLGICPLEEVHGCIIFHVATRSPDLSSNILQVGDQVNRANQSLDRLNRPSGIPDVSEQAVGLESSAAGSIDSLATCLRSLLDRYKVFMGVVDGLAEVHPYVKFTWTILSSAFRVALSQKGRDEAIENLATIMSDLYAFLCEANQVKQFKSQAKILIVMVRQTEECAYFIQGYAETKSFLKRTVKHIFTTVDKRITLYQEKFKHLKEAFQQHTILETEIIVTRILDVITQTTSAIDLNDIPYAKGVRFSGTPRCLPGTREEILEKIQLALSGTEDKGTSRIVLLTGMAGYGKSAVASTIAERFEERRRLASSFFFDRNDHNRNRVDNVLTTIARDIADGNPEFREKLSAIAKDSKSLRNTTDVREQFALFIQGPAQQLITMGPIVVVFDGFDECGDPRSRKDLIDVFAKELMELPGNFRILLTARPEEDIMRSLASLPFVNHIRMENIDKKSTQNDLTAFVVKELSDIEKKLEIEWPQRKWRDELVRKAGDLFIWMSTACRFIKNDGKGGTNYLKRLKLILSETPHSAPLAPLDELYLRVLSSVFDEKDLDAMTYFKAVIGKVLVVKVPLSGIAISDILEIEGCAPREDAVNVVKSVAPFLGSVLIGSSEWGHPLHVLHLSFKEFLTDQSRSRAFCINTEEQTKTMTKLCLDAMRQHLKYDLVETGDSTAPNPDLLQVQSRLARFETLQYVCRYWVNHAIDLDTCDKSILSQIWAFLRIDALHWIEALSLTKQLDYGVGCLNQLSQWLKVQKNHDIDTEPIAELIHDMKRLLLAFGHLVACHALQIYDSSLVFVPHGTTLFKHYVKDQRTSTLLNAPPNWSPLLSTLNGHTDIVNSVCFSPDGTRLASCSWDHTVRLWDAHTGIPIGDAMTGHTGGIFSVCFSPDCTRLASCSKDHTVRLWDAHKGIPIGAMTGHTGRVNSIHFSPDGTRLASCSRDHTVRLWDVHKGIPIGDAMTGHTDFVFSVCFSPDGTRLASCSRDHTARLWDAHKGIPIGDAMTGHTGSVNSICFSPDGTHLASCSSDCTVRLWDAHTGIPIGDSMTGHTRGINSICFSPDGTRLASCSRDSTVRLWDAHKGIPIGDAMTGHTRSVLSICFSPDNTRLASCSRDRTVRLWDAHRGILIGDAMAGHTNFVNSVCFSPDGIRLASCSEDRTVRLWDAHTSISVGDATAGHTGKVLSVCFSPNGTRLASCSEDRTVRLWDAQKGIPIGDAMTGHTRSVNSICFSPDGTRLASCSDDTVRLWDAHTGIPIGNAMTGHTDFVVFVCFSPNGTRLASCSRDRTVRLWDAHKGIPIGGAMIGHTDIVFSVCFSPDGTCLASCSWDRTVRLWDANAGIPIGDAMTGHIDIVDSVCFTPDGTRLTSTSFHETLVWDTHSMTLAGGGIDEVSFERQPLALNTKIDGEGWLIVNDKRRLWIPDQYRGRAIEGIDVGDTGMTVCIGGLLGSVIFLWLPDLLYDQLDIVELYM